MSRKSSVSHPQPWLDDTKKTTPEDLSRILTAPSDGMVMCPSRGMDQVWPNLYVGEHSAAVNVLLLKQQNFTHILNTALGKTRYHCDTNPAMYRKVGIEFMGIEANDTAMFNLLPYFKKTADYIHKALAQPGGKILVHCRAGASRSATVTIAYLMLKQNKSVSEATRIVREHREIYPNDGFLLQLCELQEILDHGESYSLKKQDSPEQSTSEDC